MVAFSVCYFCQLAVISLPTFRHRKLPFSCSSKSSFLRWKRKIINAYDSPIKETNGPWTFCQTEFQLASRPGNNSGLSGILEFGSEICENAVHVIFYIRNHLIRKSASKSQKIKKKSKKLGRLRYKYP